jgi:hypothetical protein
VLSALFILHHSCFIVTSSAQTEVTDSIVMALDSMYNAMGTAAPEDSGISEISGLSEEPGKPKASGRDWSTWRPDPQRALWLALVIPGGGQIYNRKYWKLPLIYGGFMGCLYAMNWNNNMYKDYSQAFLDISDNDPNTASYNSYLHLGAKITDSNKDRYKQIFRSRRDKYRRWRDLSFFVLVGVYALSVVDAYVDAELSVFDISKDLSLKVEPTIMNSSSSSNPFQGGALGLNCSLNF